MRPVYLIGTGQTSIAEHWGRSLERLAVEALDEARTATPGGPVQALYVANALGGNVAGQSHLGAHLATAAGLGPIEALRVEAGGASGGVAFRQAYLAVASGVYDCVAVVGVEKVTDFLEGPLESALALHLDTSMEAEQGLTLTAGWALLQQRYSYQYGYEASDFAPFPVNAHANAVHNPNALYRFSTTAAKVAAAAPVAAPIGLLDSSTVADGAAAVIIASGNIASELAAPMIRIAGSAVATASLGIAARPDPLWLDAVATTTASVLEQARLGPREIDVAEISDQHGIVAALTLEAAGFAERGLAPRWAAEGNIALGGALPLATGGGCKARGDSVGALGIYQLVELAAQLRGTAGGAQVAGAQRALAICLGGLGATVAAHILVRE
jgi:acetyl-CoA C-acetyltransferase